MLQDIEFRQLLMWEAYAAIEPFGEVREDYRSALVAQTVANFHRDPKREPFKLSDFLLRFGQRAQQQTWQVQKAIMKMWAKAANMLHESGQDDVDDGGSSR